MTRRDFLRNAAAAASAASILPLVSCGRADNEVSDFGGVRIGAISYSYRSIPASAEEILGYLRQAGMNTVELMGDPAEAFAGGPKVPSWRRVGTKMTDAERAEFNAAREAYNEAATIWRLSAPIEKFEELGKMYKDAGVEIDILKLGDPKWPDAQIDYAFRAARAVGARGISFEISDEAAKRMAPFADKHQMYVGMHNHTQVGKEGFSFDTPLSFSPHNMLNLDIGHYVAGTGESPIPIIQKYHDRITHLHLKDRKTPANGGDNVPWGQGDTPIKEVLQLLKREKYPISAMIELEYPIPDGSDVLSEIAKCVEYCREALA
ncbi:MAG: sugar phosphate isomerase/epimerase [Verrucomicrobiae bacterium]|nr:sugar phosphate isomerase/epimerase [Verrucomicrobiae bacterium]